MLPGKPMLAAGGADLEKLRYPIYATPKVDGVRCINKGGEMFSRTLKKFPSLWINEMAGKAREMGYLLNGLDGELIVSTNGVFNSGADRDETGSTLPNRTTSALMTHGSMEGLRWYLFDTQEEPHQTYEHRYLRLMSMQLPYWVYVLNAHRCMGPDDVLYYERHYVLERGYEGLVLRDPHAPYKFGRSTLREQGLVRYTTWETSEAEILDLEEEMENRNELLVNEQGFNKRSSHQENKVPKGRMGSLLVRDLKTGVEFNIGTGFDHALRQEMWDKRSEMVGRIVTYRFKPAGAKDKPRFPAFRMLRSNLDR